MILSVTNTGNLPLSYQWYFTNGITTNALSDPGPGPSGTSTLSGSTSNILTIGNARSGDSGGYFVTITNAYGATTSTIAQVIISSGSIPPSISGLNDQTNTAGTGSRAARGINVNDNTQTTSSAGGDAAHNNVQPTMILNYLIFAGA